MRCLSELSVQGDVDSTRPFRSTTFRNHVLERISIAVMLTCSLVGCGDSGSDGTNPPNGSIEIAAESELASEERPGTSPVDSELTDPAKDREEMIAEADRLMESRRSDEASSVLTRILISNPNDVEVVFRLANINASVGKLGEAIELLETIPPDHPEAGIPALGTAADWCLRAERYADAERKYLRLLERVPNAGIAHRQLAFLLNRQGRRHEAADHVRELCKLGDVRQDELHSLIVLSDAMVSDPEEGNNGGVAYVPIGPSGRARVLFTEKRFAEAAEELRATVMGGTAPPAVVALYGRALAEAQDDQGFVEWVGQVDEPVKQFSEYWAAVAAYLAGQQQTEAAIRASLEALDRDPTDFAVINRMLNLFKVLDSRDEYARWESRWKSLHQILTTNNKISNSPNPDVESIDELASQLFAVDRKLEAVIWKWLETYYRKLPEEALAHWSGERQKLLQADESFPKRASRLCGMDLQAYRAPNLDAVAHRSVDSADDTPRRSDAPFPARFRNASADVGIEHAYRVSEEDQVDGFAMYQQPGGGVAVADYDLDGWSDLYFAQGAAQPPEFITEASDVLYRNTDGRVSDVTGAALASEGRYTIGCTAGDWNQDGFPDFVTTSIGGNWVSINQGDGTFSRFMLEGSDDLNRMPSSIAIADLDGDRIPDLFELNYIQDETMARLPERDDSGSVIDAVGPGDFDSAIDRIGIGDGRGGVRLTPISDSSEEAHKGLGLVIADFDGKPGNEVFVGNDKSPNQMWVRDPSSGEWTNVAVIVGNAYSSGGASTASMGVAAGDYDGNGQLDLQITNFQSESVCLYLNRDGAFRDRAIEYKLGVPSRSVLGFGSQSLDYDNDGLRDLAVCNGHIDRYRSMSGDFEQLPQLFSNLGDRFELADVDDSSEYWNSKHLGRGLTRIDFNRDGREDFVITHVGERSALMVNETETKNHWIQFRLVGVESERDAIGAKVTVMVDGSESTHWVIGGDGYLARNEPVVSFGLGNASSVDLVEIVWPSRRIDRLKDLTADQRVLVVENVQAGNPQAENSQAWLER